MWDDMYSHMNGVSAGWFGYGLVHMALFWGLLVVALIIVWRVYAGARNSGSRASRDAVDILEQRFARGEIDQGEFEEKMSALGARHQR